MTISSGELKVFQYLFMHSLKLSNVDWSNAKGRPPSPSKSNPFFAIRFIDKNIAVLRRYKSRRAASNITVVWTASATVKGGLRRAMLSNI